MTNLTHNRLDVLINNAGCMVNTRTLVTVPDTDLELDTNFATNTLGTYLLTTGLVPLLARSVRISPPVLQYSIPSPAARSEQPRVVTVSSGGMLVQKLDTEDLQFTKECSVLPLSLDHVSMHCRSAATGRSYVGISFHVSVL